MALRKTNPLANLLIGPVLLALLLSLAPPARSAPDEGRIFVYLEVPAAVAAPTTLVLESLELVGPDGSLPLVPVTRELVAEELSGRQLLLATRRVPNGLYSSLRVTLAEARLVMGVATVTPEVSAEGQEIPIELTVDPDRAGMVFLSWNPRPLSEEDLVFEASLTAGLRDLPPSGTLAFVSCLDTGAVMVLDRLQGTVVAALTLDTDPRGMAYLPGERTLYVALAGRDALAVVDGESLVVRQIAPLSFGDDPDRILLSGDRSTLYVLNRGSRTLLALGTWSLQERFRTAVGEGPRGMAQDPATHDLYVACEDEDRIVVVDHSGGTVTGGLTLGPAPREIAVDPLNGLLYVGGGTQRRVHVLDLGSGEITAGPNICGTVGALAFNKGTGRLFAGVPDCRSVAVLRPLVGLEFASLDLPVRPGLMTFDPDDRQLLVTLPETGGLAVCNPVTGQVERIIELGGRPYAVVAP